MTAQIKGINSNKLILYVVARTSLGHPVDTQRHHKQSLISLFILNK